MNCLSRLVSEGDHIEVLVMAQKHAPVALVHPATITQPPQAHGQPGVAHPVPVPHLHAHRLAHPKLDRPLVYHGRRWSRPADVVQVDTAVAGAVGGGDGRVDGDGVAAEDAGGDRAAGLGLRRKTVFF